MATSEGFKDFVLECLERANAEFGAKFSFSSRKTIPRFVLLQIQKSERIRLNPAKPCRFLPLLP